MNNIDKSYIELVKDILKNGFQKSDRTGTGTISVFGRQIVHNMRNGFPLLTTKKMAWKQIVTELKWFLGGDTNIRYLIANDCHIWNGDAYKKYRNTPKNQLSNEDLLDVNGDGSYMEYYKLKAEDPSEKDFPYMILNNNIFCQKWGNLGPVYGKQWRKWKNGMFEEDQIKKLIEDLRENPDSRRMMVSAWNVAEIEDMTLPPCHYGFQIYSRELSAEERSRLWFNENYEQGMSYLLMTHEEIEKNPTKFSIPPKRAISLMWNQRSVDVGLGLPFNIASYGLLLLMIADEVQMFPDLLIGNLGDCHIYNNHIETLKEQIEREPFEEPQVIVQDGICSMMNDDIVLKNYKYHPSLKMQLSN